MSGEMREKSLAEIVAGLPTGTDGTRTILHRARVEYDDLTQRLTIAEGLIASLQDAVESGARNDRMLSNRLVDVEQKTAALGDCYHALTLESPPARPDTRSGTETTSADHGRSQSGTGGDSTVASDGPNSPGDIYAACAAPATVTISREVVERIKIALTQAAVFARYWTPEKHRALMVVGMQQAAHQALAALDEAVRRG